MRTHHNHRNAVAAHNFLQHLKPAHSRHFQIERNHLRPEFVELFQTEIPIDRGAHHLDRIVSFENLRDELTHQRRVVHHQHADWFGTHCRTSGAARAVRSVSARNNPDGALLASADVKRSTTAGRFTISTTRPSPRIEAPLTKSVAIVWSSRALMTNSSSPSSASTISPSFRPAKLMTRTKSFK